MAKKSSASSRPARLKSMSAADSGNRQLAGMVRLRDVRKRKVAVSVRLDANVLEWLKSKGGGHLTLINDILANVMEAEHGTDRVR